MKIINHIVIYSYPFKNCFIKLFSTEDVLNVVIIVVVVVVVVDCLSSSLRTLMLGLNRREKCCKLNTALCNAL